MEIRVDNDILEEKLRLESLVEIRVDAVDHHVWKWNIDTDKSEWV